MTASTSHYRTLVLGKGKQLISATWRFGSVAGIPLYLHINWVLTALLVTWSLAAGYFPQVFPGAPALTYWALGVVTSFLFFLSVLLHEIGHALVALREGVPVNSITLFVFGGVAHIAHEPATPGSEFRIVAAGPLTSFLLAGLFYGIQKLGHASVEVYSAGLYLFQVNLILAFFNLIPGFPLDGGRILRSILWKLAGNFQRATRWATYLGLGIAAAFVLGGAALMLGRSLLAGLWVVFIGWYLFMAAREGYRQALSNDPTLAPFEWDGTVAPGTLLSMEIHFPGGALQKTYALATVTAPGRRLPFTQPNTAPIQCGLDLGQRK